MGSRGWAPQGPRRGAGIADGLFMDPSCSHGDQPAEREEDVDGCLVLTGGGPDTDSLYTVPDAVRFVAEFFSQGRPVGAISGSLRTMIEAGLVRGRWMTSGPNPADELRNSGADWSDEAVVVDQGPSPAAREVTCPASATRSSRRSRGRAHRPGSHDLTFPGGPLSNLAVTRIDAARPAARCASDRHSWHGSLSRCVDVLPDGHAWLARRSSLFP